MQTAYFVNAFTTDKVLSGNPAAVCLLSEWPAEQVMQDIAAQHNLSETAFLVEMAPATYAIRWFTPLCEVDLCGHATLAAAHILFEYFLDFATRIVFESASGELSVSRQHAQLTLNFPARELSPVSQSAYANHFSCDFLDVLSNGHSLLLVCESQQQVADFSVDHSLLTGVGEQIIYLSAAGVQSDFVCRVFAPKLGVVEDPVTGSAYTSLGPYWSAKLQKTKLSARQLSSRGGKLAVEVAGDRVLIGGEARTIMIGQWMVEPSYGV